MSELKRVIQLHSICVTSLTNPHDDLLGDMKMFAHLIIEDRIFLQTLPVASEDDQMSWKLGFRCNIPAHAPTFSVAILRQSEMEGTRLVGYVEIGRGEVLDSVESSRSFQLQLNKVNPDGPSLNFYTVFSVAELPYLEVASHLDPIGMPELTIVSVKNQGIGSELEKMYEDSRETPLSMDTLRLRVMHERILLSCQSNANRAQWLNILGDIFLQSYQASGTVEDLNQAVCSYNDAVRDDQGSVLYLTDLGRSLLDRFEQLGNLLDINRSVVILEVAVALTPDGHPNMPSQLSNLGNSLLHRFNQLGSLDDLNQSVLRFEAAVALTPNGHPEMPSQLSNLGNSLLSRFEQLGGLDDLNNSVLRFETAVALTPDGHPGMPSQLSNLGISLLSRFEQLGGLDDLNQAVLRFEAAVALNPDGHPNTPSQLNNLGNSLLTRFQWLGGLDDLNKAVLRFEAAVALTPNGHLNKASQLNNLANSLLCRFKQLGGLDDLNQSVLLFEAAVALTPDGHPHKASNLNNLGNSLLSRFRRLGGLDDLNQSVLLFEAAAALTPDGHSNKASHLNNFGNSLVSRFQRLGGLDDLNKAVLKLEAAIALTPNGHPNKASCLNNLANSLLCRFKRLGSLDDINQSVLRFEAAVALTPNDHPGMPSQLSNLGNSLLHRFKRLGSLDDLNQSVLRFEAAIALTPEGHPDMPLQLSNLGNSLLHHFKRLGGLDDLNQSVLRFETAVALTPDGHPDKPSRLDNLGTSLSHRFERIGGLDDLHQSVLKFEAAVALTPDGHPDMPSHLSNLGNSLLHRFKRLGSLEDLHQSVLRFEAAIALTPNDHPNMPSRLNNLGISLLDRFKQLASLDDLNQSVLRLEAAVALTLNGHPNMPSQLNNLGFSLLYRFEQLGGLDDLNQSVLRFEAAVALTPDGHPDKPSRLDNLGNSLHRRFEQLDDSQDSQKVLLYYSLAACSATGPARIRFLAARRWARHAHFHQAPSVLHAYTTAIKLLPELAWLGLSITDRHHHLSQAGELVRDAASAAIAVYDYQKAVEWLDQGRSVIWGQLLNLRTPVDELRKSHPGLANQLVSLSTSLEIAGTQSDADADADAIEPQSLQSVAQKSHALALQRDHVLQKIRELPEFERFLLPRPISELSLASKKGPVAIVNISNYSCDALILMPDLGDQVIHVPLHDFTLHEAQSLAKSLASIVGTPGRSDRLDGHREGYMDPDDIFCHILSELWFKIVHPVLNALAVMTPVSQDLGRIWWCPTGPLAFLPLHAAGLYSEDQPFGSRLSDFLISSYTPSLTALVQGYRPQSESQTKLQLLAVTQPLADGQSYIPGTQEELQYIKQHAKGKVPVLSLDNDMATIEKVQKGMKDSRWVHFACHGVQSTSPTESALLLAGSSRLTLSNIIQLSLPDADLAFLSACQTATGSQELQDESVHIAAGMLLAGYRGVIGTMWSIMDNDAPQVASDVYTHLLEASPPDPKRAAEALHLAVRKLRERPGTRKSFLHWVPFIHFGV